jgi:hypothetical protein
VIVRNGIDYGLPSDLWKHLFYDLASALYLTWLLGSESAPLP